MGGLNFGKIKKFLNLANKLFGVRGEKLPTICIFGAHNLKLFTPTKEAHEEKRLDCRCYSSDAKVEQVLVRDKPHVLISIGKLSSFPHLSKAPFEVRKRWLHYDSPPDLTQQGIDAYNCYLRNLFDENEADGNPLVTVFTPTFKTGEKISRAFLSLKEQTYSNWEWIIVDDSDDGGETFRMLRKLAKKDHRIQVFKPGEHSGMIGRLKNWACSLGKGRILVELDHDDALTDYALDSVVKGFQQSAEAGFLYTDCAEIYEDGGNLTYREGWAFGYG